MDRGQVDLRLCQKIGAAPLQGPNVDRVVKGQVEDLETAFVNGQAIIVN